MTVKQLIVFLQHLPQDYIVNVDRGGAFSDAKSIELNHARREVFISADANESGFVVEEYRG